MLKTGIEPDLADMFRRGCGFCGQGWLAAQMLAAAPAAQPPQAPSEADFLQVANDFWYHTVWTAKHLRRVSCGGPRGAATVTSRRGLLCMLEWHARATRGPEHDTWMRGRFLEEWADPRAVMETSSGVCTL